MLQNCQTIHVSVTSEQRSQLSICQTRKDKLEQDLVEHQKFYETWSQKKADVIVEYADVLKIEYTILDKPLDTIARDIIQRLKFLGVAEGAESWIYRNLPKEYKRDFSFGEYYSTVHPLILEKSKVDKTTLQTSQWVNLTQDEKKELIEDLDKTRRTLTKKAEEEGIDLKKPKVGPRVTQGVPPEDQQGSSEWSEAIGETATEVQKIADYLKDIRDKAEIYKPLDPKIRAKMAAEWKETITDGIIRSLRLFFIPAKDNKWSLGLMRWMEVMIDRITQSKHAAGKMNEDFVTDPITGEVQKDKNGKPVKRFISRERVGDAEKPTFNMAVRMIRAIKGLYWMEYWIEKDIGGYRRHRKWILHDYFADAAFGSIASGGPGVEEEKA
jgi:hypothetical protein